VIEAAEVHPVPSRTRQLSPPAPMVVCGQLHARVGHCQLQLFSHLFFFPHPNLAPSLSLSFASSHLTYSSPFAFPNHTRACRSSSLPLSPSSSLSSLPFRYNAHNPLRNFSPFSATFYPRLSPWLISLRSELVLHRMDCNALRHTVLCWRS
jgi:hypothetical protein